MAKPGDIRIGISGWTYAPWRGVFFPERLPRKRELAYAADSFRSIEVNGTFYSLQRPESFARWAAAAPEGFVYAVKGPRFITHARRLRQAATPLANFFASGVLRLGAKLGPILWQFPANFRFDENRLGEFLDMLPRDTEAAAALARRHDDKVRHGTWLETDERRRLRHAVEIRHESFVDPAFIELLRAQGIALVCADTVAWPRLMDVTADFVYCRLHGAEELYASGYDDNALREWAGRVRTWARGGEVRDGDHASPQAAAKGRARDVYLYFDNDAKVRAPFDARRLMELVGESVRAAG